MTLEVTLSELQRRRQAIEETPLTDQELTEAILEAKRKKWNRIRNDDYWTQQELIKPK